MQLAVKLLAVHRDQSPEMATNLIHPRRALQPFSETNQIRDLAKICLQSAGQIRVEQRAASLANPENSSGQPGDGSGDGNPKSGTPGDKSSSSGTKPQSGNSSGNPSGPITGPGGGVTGAITKVENPEGVGISTGDGTPTQKQDSTQDSITVPVDETGNSPGAGDGSSPTPAPETGGADSGAVGGLSPGGKSSQTGSGSAITIHTPFTQVLEEYAQRAATALDHAYIPQDAKQYVRDYFAQLGK